jgi:hypothetical protein
VPTELPSSIDEETFIGRGRSAMCNELHNRLQQDSQDLVYAPFATLVGFGPSS